jgi:hypothetical protein
VQAPQKKPHGAFLLALLSMVQLPAQLAATHRVLELDGTKSFVELLNSGGKKNRLLSSK